MRVFAWFLGLIGVGLAAIAAFSYPLWLLLHPYFDFPFHRIGERAGMLALLVGFPALARHLGLNDRNSLGYGIPRRRFLADSLLGLSLGVLSMAAVVLVLTSLGLLDWSPGGALSGGAAAKLVLARLSSGIAVALIEETFLRGAMLTGIQREAGSLAAVILTALVYAATHFFASFRIAAGQVDAASGIRLLEGTLATFAHPGAIADAFTCLFAVGVILGAVRVATGNIAACIGLHAGWVWVMLVTHGIAKPVADPSFGFLVSRFDGFIGWLVLAWTLPLGAGLYYLFTRRAAYVNGARRSSR
ncbi:MAG: CPBP family glutamic-type intramembrane protease [Steroidobacteraceae bacterium]